jgi:hypothetical protein
VDDDLWRPQWRLPQPRLPRYRVESERYCGQGAVTGVSPDTDEEIVIPLSCKSWSCPRCADIKRLKYIRRLAAGQPQREFTLTTRSDPNMTAVEIVERMKRAFVRLVGEIRDDFGSFEYALVWELTKAGTPHAHVLMRGSYIPQRWLSAHWHALGEGKNVDIRAVKNHRKHAAHLCKYLGKDVGQTALHLAGKRIIQFSLHWDLPSNEPSKPSPYEGYNWQFIGLTPPQIIEKLRQAGIRFTATPTPEDGFKIRLDNPDHMIDWVWDPDEHKLSVCEIDRPPRSPP